MSTRRRLLGFVLGFMPALSMAQAMPPDVAGGKDHPLISRFAGSQMVGYQKLAFETGRFFLPTSDKSRDSKKEIDTDKPVSVEGEVTRLVYITPPGKSALEVHRNFEQALKQAGVKIITAADGRGAWWEPGTHWRANFGGLKFTRPWALDIPPFDREGLYLYGTVVRGGVEVSVSVLSGPASRMARDVYKLSDATALSAVAIQIVETKAMATGQVTVDATALARGLESDGKLALYGIYFDTGKSELKPDSKPQLDEMGKLLQNNAALRVYVVGHTDNQGSLDTNLALSRARAQAVVDALVKNYKIDPKRLGAAGVASYAPVGSNASDAGRALNRRVELVLQ